MVRYSTFKIAALAGVALVAEATLLEACALKGARAEALLSLACFAALFARDSRQGLLGAWLVGLVKDAASVGPLGLHALLFLGAGWAVLQIRQVLFRESPVTQLAVAFVATCGVQAAAALFIAATAGGIPIGIIAAKTLLSALLTAALTPPLHLLLAQTRWLVR
ncbi:MAG TPA: rod shape-determining protein MreD [Planctomycetota bacterium]|jgi:rod shape-determining protein MreD|nr:rod shape-determining protein MreD [Planctomycetota bacterium]